MRSINRKIFSALFAFIFALISFLPLLSLNASAADTEDKPVSPALYVLADKTDMAMSALNGNAISFDKEDFGRALNLSRIASVTFTELPALTDGELRLGNRVVTVGQRISGSGISQLTYVQSEAGLRTSSFKFRVNDSPVDVKCNLYFLDSLNAPPVLGGSSEGSLTVSAHRDITVYGSLPCYDPDGDDTAVEIVSYPKSGILILTDPEKGEYSFTPTASYSGKDSFTYVARDKYGNYSASAEVTIKVSKPSSSVSFVDMKDSKYQSAALTMAENGIMNGSQVGLHTYFDPNGQVSREEFLVMAMKSIGIRDVMSTNRSAFSDDGDASADALDYIKVAYELGYIKGEALDDGKVCFYPKRSITRAEAACIVANMIDAATPTVYADFTDSSDIPAWARSSVYALNYMGIMPTEEGGISPNAYLTRAEAAGILAAVVNG